jgi:hypothetical protein
MKEFSYGPGLKVHLCIYGSERYNTSEGNEKQGPPSGKRPHDPGKLVIKKMLGCKIIRQIF